MRSLLALAGLAAALAAPTYWWKYANMDAESEDIRQLPCAQQCTLAELEAACLAEPACVAFNRHGGLKKSLGDIAPDSCVPPPPPPFPAPRLHNLPRLARSCDLYVQKSTPQPSPTPAPPPPAIAFWPIPTTLSMGATPLTVSPSLAFTVTPPNPDLAAYAARTAALMFQHAAPAPGAGALSSVVITVANPTAPLTLGVDESYTLNIPADGSAATITAATNYGAYWGLQTLAQAVQFDFDSASYAVAAAPVAVKDAPKFAWRGILIDTDRHWLSLPTIFLIIDALTFSKMNILVRSATRPLLTRTLCTTTPPPPSPSPASRHTNLTRPTPFFSFSHLFPPFSHLFSLSLFFLLFLSTGTLWTGSPGPCRAWRCPSCGPRPGRPGSATPWRTWTRWWSTRARAVCASSPSSIRPATPPPCAPPTPSCAPPRRAGRRATRPSRPCPTRAARPWRSTPSRRCWASSRRTRRTSSSTWAATCVPPPTPCSPRRAEPQPSTAPLTYLFHPFPTHYPPSPPQK